ncbi:MAG: hypothetical protein ILP18_11930 [Treponema sp.]|nr:hypothetical protein [Treponema sp.]
MRRLKTTNTSGLIGAKQPEAEERIIPPDELDERVVNFLDGYYLIGVWKDRKSFYALSEEELKGRLGCIGGLFLCYILDGELDKAWDIIRRFGEDECMRHTLILVHPKATMRQISDALDRLKKLNYHINSVVLSAGRPSVLNGVADFTRLGPFLERNRERFIEDIGYMYTPSLAPAIYELCLAEWYYQQNRVAEAGAIVDQIMPEFDNDAQRRLLFVALYLKAKVEFSSNKISDVLGYIKSVRKYAHDEGEQEFSYNIDAAEAYAALFDGKYDIVSGWLGGKDTPDEFADFCMLDLYRYMIKMRCYIVNKRFMAVIAIAERLRPLLKEGNRLMDLCELDLLLSICYFRAEEIELALVAFDRVIKTARRRGYFRLIADEGAAIMPLLVHYIKTKGETPWLLSLAESTRDIAASYPLYLMPINKGGTTFSKMEVSVLKFLEQGKNKEEIADYFFVSVNTVKFHMKNIYTKLEASTPQQAVWEARRMGII